MHCAFLLALIRDKILPAIVSDCEKIVYLKMKAEVGKYLSRVTIQDNEVLISNARDDYNSSKAYAEQCLEDTNACRIALELESSLFDALTLNNLDKAAKCTHQYVESIKNALGDKENELVSSNMGLINELDNFLTSCAEDAKILEIV